MVTIGQKISEFITRAEAYIANDFYDIVVMQQQGEDFLDKLYKMQGLYSFLVELQALYTPWTDREIQQFMDYWDDECKLKAFQGIIPDPYRHYENVTPVVNMSTTMVVPGGIGYVFKDSQESLIIIPESDLINSDYGLE